MNTVTIVLLVVLGVVAIGLVALLIYGRKLQKKADANEDQMKAGAQTVSLLVIDKKRMKLKEANLPKMVVDQTPRYLRGAKVPIVKAKIGPKITNLICEEKIFKVLPIKKEVKAVINGLYIMDVKGLRSGLDVPEKKKKGFFKRNK